MFNQFARYEDDFRDWRTEGKWNMPERSGG